MPGEAGQRKIYCLSAKNGHSECIFFRAGEPWPRLVAPLPYSATECIVHITFIKLTFTDWKINFRIIQKNEFEQHFSLIYLPFVKLTFFPFVKMVDQKKLLRRLSSISCHKSVASYFMTLTKKLTYLYLPILV